MSSDLVPLAEAYKIGDRMSQPWKTATVLLSVIVLALLYTIVAYKVEAETAVDAQKIVAESLKSSINIKE